MVAQADQDDASEDLIAQVAAMDAKNGNDKKAIELYERALARSYAQVDWRFELAKLLAKTGDLDGRDSRGPGLLAASSGLPGSEGTSGCMPQEAA